MVIFFLEKGRLDDLSKNLLIRFFLVSEFLKQTTKSGGRTQTFAGLAGLVGFDKHCFFHTVPS